MTVDILIDTLEETGIPVYRQGSFPADEEYPPDLITFWNTNTEDHDHYDNRTYGIVWEFTVYVYSADPAKVYTVEQDIRSAIVKRGGIVYGAGYDVTCDVPTHTGRALDVLFLEIPGWDDEEVEI